MKGVVKLPGVSEACVQELLLCSLTKAPVSAATWGAAAAEVEQWERVAEPQRDRCPPVSTPVPALIPVLRQRLSEHRAAGAGINHRGLSQAQTAPRLPGAPRQTAASGLVSAKMLYLINLVVVHGHYE